jgi:hypothetical protein
MVRTPMKTKTKIIRAFLENNSPKTIKDISKVIRADYRITHTATQRLVTENILLSTRIGPAHLCRLNPQHLGIDILYAEEERKNDLLKDKNLKQLHKDILTNLETVLFVLLYVRSRVPGVHLVFISNEPQFKKKVENVVNNIPLQIHTEVLTEQEYIQINQNGHYQNRVALHNTESYYALKSKTAKTS